MENNDDLRNDRIYISKIEKSAILNIFLFFYFVLKNVNDQFIGNFMKKREL